MAVLAQLDSEEAEQSSTHEDRIKRSSKSKKSDQRRVSSWRPDADEDWRFIERVRE